MGTFSDYLEAALLNEVLGGSDYTPPSTIYIAAFTAAPNDGGGGTEASGSAYARASVTNNGTNWPSVSDGTGPKTNNSAITFTTASGGNWGDILALAALDASSSGNLLMHDQVTTVTINDGDTLEIAAGDWDVTLD